MDTPVGTAVDIAADVRAGRRSAREVLDECLARIDASNDALNAFVHLDPEAAQASAAAVDAAVARGEDPGPFAGVPIGVKDLEDCAGMPTSHGSLLWKGRPPVPADSVHVARLRAAGAVPVGKTAAPEFGMVCFTHTKAWGTTRNPWNLDRTPGGSSGGSAAAVAAGLVPFCTASDGGGSIRIPAAFTGLFGLKPSFGRIPDEGSAPGMTAVYGALTTTVRDSARHLDVTAGPDDHDKASLPAPPVRYEDVIEALDVAGLRAAWSPDYGFAVVEPEIEAIAEEAAMALVGAARLTLVDRAMALTDPVKVWLTAGAADMWMGLEPGMWPERADEFDGMVAASLRGSAGVTLPRYGRWAERRNRLEHEVADLFRDVDVVLSPATAVPAFAAAGPMPEEINGQATMPAMCVPFTMVANLCWSPAASIPCGATADGLPVGLQVMARRHADDVVLRLARIFEQARPWPRHAPARPAAS